MKKLLAILFISIVCSSTSFAQEQKSPQPAKVGANYGQSMDKKQAITVKKLESNLSTSSRFSGKVVGKVAKVCKMSGCYLTLQTENNDNPIMVRFAEDYTVPQDIVGKHVVVQGVATVRNKEDKETKLTQKSITIIADGVLVIQ